MPDITIPGFVITGLQIIFAFSGAFALALWVSLIIWTFRDARLRSRDIFAVILATLMVIVFGPLGLALYFLLRPPVTLAELYERSLEEEALLQDLEERPRCPGCSRQVKDEWIICPDCHTILKRECTNCHNPMHLVWTICPFCGDQVGMLTDTHDHHDSAGQLEPEPEPALLPPPEDTQPIPVATPPTESVEPEAFSPIPDDELVTQLPTPDSTPEADPV